MRTFAPARSRSRFSVLDAFKGLVGVTAVGFLAWALADQWIDVRARLNEFHWPLLGVAFVCVLVGTVCSMLAYRTLLFDLGSPLPWAATSRVFFLGQIAKYLPGSLWAVAAQGELARVVGVPRRRSASALLTSILLSIALGFMLGIGLLPTLSSDALQEFWWLLLLVPLAVMSLSPSLISRAINLLLHVARRPPLERPFSRAGVARASGLLLAMWIAFGLHLGAIMVGLGAKGAEVWPGAIGGFAVAWSVGFLAVLAPAGVGPREYVLVVTLGSVVPGGGTIALTAALMSRFVMTFADAVLAAAVLVLRGAPRQAGSRKEFHNR